jgi:hypothetical protein
MKKIQRVNNKHQPTPYQLSRSAEALTDAQLQQVVGGVTPAAPLGTIQLPGSDEVVVNFEGGDPRRPIVVGNLWNK